MTSLIAFAVRLVFSAFVMIAAAFVALHHPAVNKWARENRITAPFAQAFSLQTSAVTAPTAPNPVTVAPTKSVRQRIEATIARVKAARKSIAEKRAIPEPVARDQLSTDDRDQLLRELQNLSKAHEKARPKVGINQQ
jgi:hypothetical protein